MRSDRIVVSSIEAVRVGHQIELLSLLESSDIASDQLVELGAVLENRQVGRRTHDDLYCNGIVGVGIQFAAAGAIIFERCDATVWATRCLPSCSVGNASALLASGLAPSA